MKRWFSMKLDDKDNDTGEIMIYDMIGKDPFTGEGMDATDFDTELKALGPVENVNMRINSPGGDVMVAVAIHTMIQNHPATFTASIDGVAASAASLIAMAADKIVMPENTFMLIHKPRGIAIGTDEDMMSMASNLERMGATFANAYAERSGQTPAAVMALMCEDRLMTASEAKEFGYADDISNPIRMAAAYNMALLPEKARAAMTAAIAAAPDEVVAPVVVGVDGGAEAAAPIVEPVVPVAAPPAAAAPIVALSPVATYGDAEIHTTLDLCQLAGAPDKASKFIKAKMSLDKVRETLLAARASAADRIELDPTPPETPKAHLDEWRMLQDRVKAEMGIGNRK